MGNLLTHTISPPSCNSPNGFMFLRALIADDHDVVRHGLKEILKSSKRFKIIQEAKNGADAINLALSNNFDLVILDIGLPDISGIEVLRSIKAKKPQIPVLILSMQSEEQYALRVIQAGAAGFLHKDNSIEELNKAVDTVLGGQKYITPSLAETLINYVDTAQERPILDTLSAREIQTLTLLAEGKTVGDIAALLNVSVKTVSTYRSRILIKLKLNNNSQLIRFAIEHRLVD